MPATNEQLFHELIAAAQTFLVVSTNAAEVLSDEYKTMITGPGSVLEAVLERCPKPTTMLWDGRFDLAQCDEETYTPDLPDEMRPGRVGTGVKLTHRPTGESAQSHSSADQDENRRRAQRALKGLVERKHGVRPPDPLR